MNACTRFSKPAAALLLALGLPACSLERRPIVSQRVFTASAQVRGADGRVVPITSDDLLFAGGSPRLLATGDYTSTSGATPEERVRDYWTRYLKSRLEDPLATPEFRARFGSGPFCLVSADVRRTDTFTSMTAPAETGDPLEPCPAAPDTCGNAPGVVPRLEATPFGVDFSSVPVGTTSAEQLVSVANAGAGRLCLDSPAIDPTLSANFGDFSLDASDCAPTSPEELTLGRTILGVARPSCTLRLRFTPADPGMRQAVLRLPSSDPATPVQNAPLTGAGQPGVLRASPNPLCLNTPPVMVGGMTCHRNTLTLVDDGPGQVTIRSVSLPAGSVDWAMGGYTPGPPPLTLTPGGTLSLVVRVCGPDPAGTMLVVASNSSTPTLEIPYLPPSSGCVP